MNKFRFFEWKVYKDAKDLFGVILKLVKKLPKEYRFELGSQLIRSAFSVVLNTAEGSGKTSDAELKRFLNIALGSLNEILAAVDVLYYNKLIEKWEFEIVFQKVDGITNQLGSFKKKLRK
jgi:four helix bundle protein